MQISDPPFYREPRWLLEFFSWNNLAFLAVDIYVAHSVNDFALWEEWIPFALSIAATLVLFPGLLPGRLDRSSSRWIGGLVGCLSIAVGVLGLLFHLHGTFFVEHTLKNLVYSAPFVAPLSYSGIGLLLILNRSRIKMEQEWAAWIVFLALGGFAGNFVLSLADHAQNGFFVAAEWIPVIASAFAVSFLFTLLVRDHDRSFLKLCGGVMLVQIVVGLMGAGMHLHADWNLPAELVRDRFIHGAPVFAPLLFADLAILALLGLWCLDRGGETAE